MKLRSALLTCVSLPLLAFLGSSMITLRDAWKERGLVVDARENAHAIEGLSSFVHELQKERGTSNLFLNDGIPRAAVDRQRGGSDSARTAFRQHLASARFPKGAIDSLHAADASLEAVREKVDKSEPASASRKAYTSTISRLLDGYRAAVDAPTTKGMGKMLTSLAILEQAKESSGQLRALGAGFLAADKPLSHDQVGDIYGLQSAISGNLASRGLTLSKETRSLMKEVQKRPHWRLADTVLMRMIDRSDSGKFGTTGKAFFDIMTSKINDLDEVRQSELKALEARSTKVLKDADQSLTLQAFLFLLLSCCSIGLVWFISRHITSRLAILEEAIHRASRGDLSDPGVLGGNDEVASLGGSMRLLVGSMRDLIAEINCMSAAHNQGQIDTVIDADRFQGDFVLMALGVNEMMQSQVADNLEAMGCIAAFGQGDLDAPLRPFPGQKAFINESIEKMRENIKALAVDTNTLVQAAVAGQLTIRADATKHHGAFRKIVQGINDTLDTVVGFIDQIPTPVMVINNEFSIMYMNKAGAALGGRDHLELSRSNEKCHSFFKTGDCQTANCACAQAMEANQLTGSETDAHPGTHNLDITYTAVPIRNQSGEIVGALEVVMDQTRIKQAEKLMTKIGIYQDAEVSRLNEALQKVAGRDLTIRIETGSADADTSTIREKFIAIASAFNMAIENLDQALAQVTDSTSQVASASGQISSGSQNLAQGANEQASSLEEISASLEELSSMTRQNAENASQAKSLAGEADQNAKVGTDAMTRMSNSIQKIKESSDQTAKIVKTIDEIAMQTNLLALNAAVEAARAGEAGRGFAVVAEEVRNLAQRSAQAAKNTADMIGESVRNADDGVKIATEVSSSFEKIAGSSKKVNDLIAEIAVASKEQAAGIKQVNDAVGQMDKVTQQNAANAEESASASEELSSQAAELQAMVAQFRIGQANAC
jgi:methyl-accepting chemotaxis protein